MICFRPASGPVPSAPPNHDDDGGRFMQERRESLTKRALDAVKPADEDYQIWDTKVRGFGVRVYPSGAKSFIVQYRNAAGRTRKMLLGRYGPLTVDKARN